MDPRQLFTDSRLSGICVYCGVGQPDSRDHVPSKTLLDKPYPKNLSVVASCTDCNRGFSIDEQYLACFLECVIQGTTEPNTNFRESVARTLKHNPLIKARINESKSIDENGNIIWQPELKRIRNVVLKLARGHLAHELGVHHIEEPLVLIMLPTPLLSENQLASFNSLETNRELLYPEIGSRAFIESTTGKPTSYENWRTVQNGLYRYTLGQSNRDWVKFVLSEYLACEVVWE